MRVARARRDEVIEQANAEMVAAIKAAIDAGALVKDVAAAAGFTRQHISELYKS